jgi:hypothetical protein
MGARRQQGSGGNRQSGFHSHGQKIATVDHGISRDKLSVPC